MPRIITAAPPVPPPRYTVDQWYQLIAKGLEMETLVIQQRAAMDAYDPQRRIGLIVDEWGTWHPVEEGTNPRFLYQQNTLRDALVAATTLDIFNRHADKVVMANIAQTVNVLQAMVLTEGEKMLVTPTGLRLRDVCSPPGRHLGAHPDRERTWLASNAARKMAHCR